MTVSCHLNALGIVCALGAGKDAVADRLFRGDSGAQVVDHAVTDGTALPVAAVDVELPDIPADLSRFSSRNLSLVLKALEEIEDNIRAAIQRFGPDRVAVVMGSSTSGISAGEAALARAVESGEGELPAGYDFQQQEIGSVAESIAVLYELEAPAITVSTACSSSAKALATARNLIRRNLADAVVVGGCDSNCKLTLNGFHSLSALARTNCQPFSVNRSGTMIGEGAAVFLMSRDPIGPEFCGVGESSDAYNMTAPQPDGIGAISAMQGALSDAGIQAGEVGYVNLHGTATDLNDAMESRALNKVFPKGVLCSSSKPQFGHTLGAAGAIEIGVCWLVLECNPESRLPPHLGDGVRDPNADLSGLVTIDARLPTMTRQYLMSNSYAFGGSNVSVILGSHRGV